MPYFVAFLEFCPSNCQRKCRNRMPKRHLSVGNGRHRHYPMTKPPSPVLPNARMHKGGGRNCGILWYFDSKIFHAIIFRVKRYSDKRPCTVASSPGHSHLFNAAHRSQATCIWKYFNNEIFTIYGILMILKLANLAVKSYAYAMVRSQQEQQKHRKWQVQSRAQPLYTKSKKGFGLTCTEPVLPVQPRVCANQNFAHNI